jgi:hypothetical protein
VDGVLNYRGCKYKLPDSNIYFVDDEKVKLLKQIIDATDCKTDFYIMEVPVNR